MKHVMHSRKATQGVHDYSIEIERVRFKFVDVGGARFQRMKWSEEFNGATIVLFMVESNGFDKFPREDHVTNRIVESVNVFETIVNGPWFRHVSVVVLFNNTDLLKDKIQHKSIKDYFSDFQGDPRRLKDVQDFLVHMFDSVRQDKSTDVSYFFITSVDTKDVRETFNVIIREKIPMLQLRVMKEFEDM